jgi:hypothetical protein
VDASPALPNLTMLVELMKPGSFKTQVAKAQKAAWNEWAGIALPARFGQTAHPNPMGFSRRSAKYMRRRATASAAARVRAQQRGTTAYNANEGKTKGDLPDYVYTGAGKRQVMGYKPKVSYSENEVKSKRSIHMNALNALKSDKQRGWTVLRETVETKTVTRRAHTRRSRNGTPVAVRSYQQTAHVFRWSGTLSNKTYAQEWAFKPEEVAQVSRRADEILAEALRKIGYDKKGKLRLGFRRELNRRSSLAEAA